MRAIQQCRTAALGGHRLQCDQCGKVRIAYNSCGNRHCPKCQTLAKERWLQARRAELLQIPYFHVVLTLPHDLNPLAQGNPRLIYNLLFRAGAETLLSFGRDRRHLGGTLGITALLHTWGQNLSQHIHLHCIVTGGALEQDDHRWIHGKPGFLFPVRALSSVFCAKYLDLLQRAYERDEVSLSSGTAHLADPAAWRNFLAQLRSRSWVVYCKRPMAGPEQVLDYLARYTHRVAISNHRLVALHEDKVTFRYRDYADGGRIRLMELSAQEFIRRFLLHVLPDNFCRIRHYGILANRNRTQRLALCRELLGQPEPETSAPESAADLMLRVVGVDIRRCPYCGRGNLQIIETFDRLPELWDTS